MINIILLILGLYVIAGFLTAVFAGSFAFFVRIFTSKIFFIIAGVLMLLYLVVNLVNAQEVKAQEDCYQKQINELKVEQNTNTNEGIVINAVVLKRCF